MSFVSLFKNRAFQTALLVGLFLTSVLIIVAMLLGNESGNFVIQVESGDIEKSIGITENLEENVYPKKLTVQGLKGISDNTPAYFLGNDYQEQLTTLKDLTEEPGRTIVDSSLYVYTFYIVNTGNGALNIELSMSISNITRNMDAAVRVMTYNQTDEIINIYQKRDTQDVNYEKYFIQGTSEFQSSTSAYSERAVVRSGTVEQKGYVKYSVLFWLEGQDPECVDEIKEGTIKFGLDVKVVV